MSHNKKKSSYFDFLFFKKLTFRLYIHIQMQKKKKIHPLNYLLKDTV